MREEIYFISSKDDRYPRRFRELARMPDGIYVRGSLPDDDVPTAAIVGARMCSRYGRNTAFMFGRELAARGVQVISGMALGVDGAAQEGALAGGGRTFAVLGCGADICYPSSNRSLYEQIPPRGGIISEFEPGTQPYPYHFPMRNRLIAALADVVIVVEAKRKSGSLITVDYALEQGRSVYAVPGRVGDALAEGCNYLIAQGAGIAWTVDAVLEELRINEILSRKREAFGGPAGSDLPDKRAAFGEPAGGGLPDQGERPDDPSCEKERILQYLSDGEKSIDELTRGLEIPLPAINEALARLLISGKIEEVGRNRYACCPEAGWPDLSEKNN